MQHAEAEDFLQKSDPILAEIIAQVGACRLGEESVEGDVLSGLVRSILYQQLSGKAAATIHQRFLQLYPDRLHPTATDILNTDDDALRGVGISRQKIGYLKDLSQKVIDGLPSLAELEKMDDEAIVKTLTEVKGVGRWTVQMLLIFRMHRLNVMPVDDLGIRMGIKKVYGLDELPNKKQIEVLAQKWQPYCSIASWYLWRSLELKA
ncbi:DNA-3-methyladenine glycosylase [Tumidithrix elongata RA019]|uniref:DNA-3-methyladenine glycosylase II n=1 Tax=Tumidithrix elongata BACA0141 TaxID=2716417 RepID=A0AAW9PZL4_9CYAN|nr:DNA-3-methyladenine glycosylase [Tumidithrix elongata RA019]